MATSRLLPYALLVASACASAQVDADVVREFVPLGVGDAWEYAYHYEKCDHVAEGGACTSGDETYTYRVVGQEVRGAETLAVIEGPGTRALFGLNADGSGWTRVTVEAGDGSAPVLPPFPFFSAFQSMVNRGPISWTFKVGAEEYATNALTHHPPVYVLARGVGLVEHSDSWRGTGGARRSDSWKLSGAVVGGVSYGGFATAAAEAPSPFVLTVGPNPTTGTVAIRAELGASRRARVEVVDVLGRRVQASALYPSGSALDVSLDFGALPAGVYVVRLFADGRPVAQTTVTRASGG